jgi:L-ascorbate metabolism protein UlaG (beta-lactamase superfamily)
VICRKAVTNRGGTAFYHALCPALGQRAFSFYKGGDTVDQVRITYLGHACFDLAYKETHVILDPYADGMVPGLGNVRASAQAVYCSHAHDDHSYRAAVTVIPVEQLPYTVQELDTPHDDKDGTLRGRNTVRVFTFGGLRVAHLGDLGRALTEQEVQLLEGVDCLLIPVGGFYTIDAETAAAAVRQLHPRVTVPMHYRTEKSGFDKIAKLESFTGLFDQVTYAGSSTLLLDADTKTQIIVLNAQNEGV